MEWLWLVERVRFVVVGGSGRGIPGVRWLVRTAVAGRVTQGQ